jgi:CHAD domain-containing protein
MAFRFELGETLLTGIPRVAREQIGTVVTALNKNPQANPKSIHEARKSLKSIRAVLRLARGGIQSESWNHENLLFQEAGRSLSAARDLQALLEALDRIANSRRSRAHHPNPNPKQKAVRSLIEDIRREINLELIKLLPHASVQVLVKQLQDAKRRTASWFQESLLQPGNEWEMLMGTGLRKTYRKARNLVSQLEISGRKTDDDDLWHELRKCAKALGYQLQLLKPIWPVTIGTLVDEIDQMTSRLGDANDLAVLQKRFREKPQSNRDEDLSARQDLICAIDRRKQKLRAQALKYARTIYSEKPGQFGRRLAGYWEIWRAKKPAPLRRRQLRGARSGAVAELGTVKGVPSQARTDGDPHRDGDEFSVLSSQ